MVSSYSFAGNVLPGILAVVFGALAIGLNKYFARGAVRFNQAILRHRFSETPYRVMYVLVGCCILVIGLLALVGVIEFRQ
jgi:hypothetical protein